MFLQRKIFPDLVNHIKKKQITVLTGMRRTGKTTIVKELLKGIETGNKLFIDLERLDNRHLFTEVNYDNIILALKQRGLKFENKIYLAIDEIQLLPNISSVLKYLYDHYNIKFIITGSSSYYLKNLFSESLSGRKKIFELFPLDFGEMLSFKEVPFLSEDFKKLRFNYNEYNRLKNYYEEFIQFGGFPEVILAESQNDKYDLLNDIISSYVNIDIKTLADFRNEREIYKLIQLLSSRVGTRLDYSKISSLLGISRITVKNYIDFFEKTYLITRISVLTKNRDREIVKAQKIYFNDTGLANILSQLNSSSQFENTVFNQLRHHNNIRYYALKTGREIDFVFGKGYAFEVKETPTLSSYKKLSIISSTAGLTKFILIGRYSSPNFTDYIWGGEIR